MLFFRTADESDHSPHFRWQWRQLACHHAWHLWAIATSCRDQKPDVERIPSRRWLADFKHCCVRSLVLSQIPSIPPNCFDAETLEWRDWAKWPRFLPQVCLKHFIGKVTANVITSSHNNSLQFLTNEMAARDVTCFLMTLHCHITCRHSRLTWPTYVIISRNVRRLLTRLDAAHCRLLYLLRFQFRLQVTDIKFCRLNSSLLSFGKLKWYLSGAIKCLSWEVDF